MKASRPEYPGAAARLLRRFVTVMLISLCVPLVCAGAEGEIKLRIATGSKTGVYYPIGCGIKRIIEEQYPGRVSVEVVQTNGTTDNLRLIDSEQVDLALVQNDTAYYFSHGQVMFSLPSSKAQAVASLYTELIQIIATKKSGIEYLDQLKGRRIRTSSPPENIGNSATMIFSLAGWEASDLTDIRCQFSQARELLLSNSLDAAFVTAGVPTPLFTESIDGIALQDYVNLIPIGESLANRLMRRFPYFVYTEIPAHTYRGQAMPVKTVGVRAILVARKGFEEDQLRSGRVPPDFVRTLTRLIFEKTDVIRNEHGVEGADLTGYHFALENGLYGILDHRLRPIIPIHPQAKSFYAAHGLLKRTLEDYLPLILWGTITLAIAAFIFRYRSILRRIAQRHIHIRLAAIFILLYVLGTVAMYLCERYNNHYFDTLGESFWSITIYVLSGYEDRPPVTLLGRIVSIFIFVLSVLFLGAVAGRFAAAFIQREEFKMPRDVENHIVICNWNDRGKRVVAELRHPEGRPDTDIVIIDDKLLNERELSRMPGFNKIFCIHKDPIRHGTLKTARVSVADTIIVLADNQSPDPDAKSAMIILALLSECKRKRPHIIAEVVNIDNTLHLKDAGANETICTTEIGVGILAHCALNKQLSVVYKDLLTYSFEGNEIYIIPSGSYPQHFVGKTFGQCAQELYQDRDHNNPVILLGVRRGDEVIMNPRQSAARLGRDEFVIEEDDALIAMAFMAPDLSGRSA